ncbi:hypothetical protein RRG08_021484 [Elysia crispata]|uniref:Uncharacterized protein n=1 Tax=Elysia crispata TaxID=231223 RepID=A0AAE1BDD5_9GAST|nr:hypothetical protein RRG08_021484 [Elysia crispata]
MAEAMPCILDTLLSSGDNVSSHRNSRLPAAGVRVFPNGQQEVSEPRAILFSRYFSVSVRPMSLIEVNSGRGQIIRKPVDSWRGQGDEQVNIKFKVQ